MASKAVYAVAVVLLLGTCSARDVVELTDKTFDKLVVQSTDYWLVEFYAPWCGHCKNLAPTWEKLGTAVKDTARIGAIDASQYTDIAGRYGVKGFPTIKEFGKDKSNPADYNGARELGALQGYVQEHSKGFTMSTTVESIKYKHMHAFVNAKSEHARFLLVQPARTKMPKWFSTVAGKARAKYEGMKFAIAQGAEAERIRKRLVLPEKASIVGISKSGEYAHAPANAGKAGAKFVQSFLKGNEELESLPSFPEPSKPKSRTSTKLAKLTAANADKKCFAIKGRMCVVVLGTSAEDLAAVARPLAKQFKLDKLSFVFVTGDDGIASPLKQSLGVERDGRALAVIKTGKRPRYAVLPSPPAAIDGFVKNASDYLNEVIGGNVRFQKFVKPDLSGSVEAEL